MAPPWNMTFTLFLVEPRPFNQWQPLLDEVFGGRFVRDEEYKANGRFRYTNYVFGLAISLYIEAKWTEGQVYCLTGNTHTSFRFDTLERMDMAFHVIEMIGGIGFAQIMSFEEFRAEVKRRESLPQ